MTGWYPVHDLFDLTPEPIEKIIAMNNGGGRRLESHPKVFRKHHSSLTVWVHRDLKDDRQQMPQFVLQQSIALCMGKLEVKPLT